MDKMNHTVAKTHLSRNEVNAAESQSILIDLASDSKLDRLMFVLMGVVVAYFVFKDLWGNL